MITASLISAIDSITPWVNQLRPLEVVGVIATGMAAMSAACVIAILTIKCGKPLVQDEPVDAISLSSEATGVQDDATGDADQAAEPLIVGTNFFAEYDGDYKSGSDTWTIYSYSDAAAGKSEKLFTVVTKSNALELIDRMDAVPAAKVSA